MVHVAVAGGTGSVGRTLVDAIVETGRHEVFVMSRKETHVFSEQSAVKVLATDYSSVDAIARILSQNKIHTVISTLSGLTPDVAEAELRLIRGAAASTAVKRFAPSEFGFDYDQDDEHVPLAWKHERRRAVSELKQHHHLEYTLFQPGFFMDYFGLPHAPSYLPPEACFLDIPRAKAAVPGSGDDLVAWTYSKDVGKFVARSLDLQAWPERSIIIGDRMSYKSLIRIVERVRGVKFDVSYDSLGSMRTGKITELPNYLSIYEFFPRESMLKTWASFGVAMATGACSLMGDTLNQKLPDVKAQDLSTFISTYWSVK